jgi:hypothetical protein
MKTALLSAVLLSVLAGAIVWAIWVWTSVGDVKMSVHGYLAMALMIVFGLIVGCGLMALVFISNRRGYDEPARRDLEPPE